MNSRCRFICIFGFLSLLVSCQYVEQTTIQTEPVSFKRSEFLFGDTTLAAYSLEADILFPISSSSGSPIDSLQQEVWRILLATEPNSALPITKQAVTAELQKLHESLLAEYKKLNPTTKEEFSRKKIQIPYIMTLSNEVTYNQNNIFSICIYSSLYQGGAHNMYGKSGYSFSVKEGRLITESDIFTAEAKELLTPLLIQAILDYHKLETVEQLAEKLYINEPEAIGPNGNFYITPEGINYIYNPYEIAPYSTGLTIATLPWASLRDIVAPNSPIASLIK